MFLVVLIFSSRLDSTRLGSTWLDAAEKDISSLFICHYRSERSLTHSLARLLACSLAFLFERFKSSLFSFFVVESKTTFEDFLGRRDN